MTDFLAPIKEQIAKVWAALDKKPTMRWGTVVTTSPVTVLLDPGTGDPAPAITTVAALTVNERVYCVEQNRRITIINRAI